MLDPVYTNVMWKQNMFEIVFKDISKFGAQNLITGSLLSKIESGKLTEESVKKFLNKARNPTDIKLNEKLQKLKSFNTKLSNDSDDDNDGGLSPPSSTIPPLPRPLSLPPLPPIFDASFLHNVPQLESKIFQESGGQQQFREIKIMLKQEEEKRIMSKKLHRLFPEVDEILQEYKQK